MIRAVLFDFDGVLTTEKTGSQSTLRSLSHHTGIPEETLRKAYYRHNGALLRGEITHEDMWAEFCAEVGQEIDYEWLHVAFVETPLDCEMLDLVEEIHQHCRTALITDNKADRIAAIFDQHHLHGHFDAVAVSAQVGSGKEAQAIFDAVLDTLELYPHECLFVDNSVKNLVVPQAMGMATVLFDDVRRDAAGLWQLLQS